jgi:hypothetical protein
MPVRLPSRYEDLDIAFRGRLRPSQPLLQLVKQAFSSMEINGGIRFLPIFGASGSGKTSAALELGTHLPDLFVDRLPREAIEEPAALRQAISQMMHNAGGRYIVAVVDQYEEVAAQRTAVPTSFVEALSLLDRGDLRDQRVLFLWLTTSREFQKALADATTRNRRILTSPVFEIEGPPRSDWPSIIEETFQFHNQERALSDYEILTLDITDMSNHETTLGAAIEAVGSKLSVYATSLHDLSTYQVVMLWPVTDGLRITRIQQFTDPRQGYKLDWNSWYRQLNAEDQQQLPLREYNRARLYFDMRLVPIAAADLHPICRELDDENFEIGQSYLNRFRSTHFYSIISGQWSPETYAPLRERESQRATAAREWYTTVTSQPTKLGKRIAKCLRLLSVNADHEQTVESPHGRVRADILVDRSPISPPNVIVEMKAFSAENTMPSSICQAVQTTLRRHAQFAGILQRQ